MRKNWKNEKEIYFKAGAYELNNEDVILTADGMYILLDKGKFSFKERVKFLISGGYEVYTHTRKNEYRVFFQQRNLRDLPLAALDVLQKWRYGED